MTVVIPLEELSNENIIALALNLGYYEEMPIMKDNKYIKDMINMIGKEKNIGLQVKWWNEQESIKNEYFKEVEEYLQRVKDLLMLQYGFGVVVKNNEICLDKKYMNL
jgi:hypothetical protein